MLCCHFILAQNLPCTTEQLKTDSLKTAVKTGAEIKENTKISTDKKSGQKKPLAVQDFDLEIRAILDYRLSRVLREDLFCLVCEALSDKEQLA